MSLTGKSYKLKRYAAGDYHVGGILFYGSPDMNPTLTQEAGSGQYELALSKITGVMPKINWHMKLQRLGDFVADYSGTNKFAFVSDEGAQTAHTLYYTDGLDSFKFTDCYTNSCTVRIPLHGAITAELESLATTYASQAYGSDPSSITDAVLTKANLNTLKIGNTSINTDWMTVDFGVTHNVKQENLGTTLPPADVYQQETKYFVNITRALKTQSFATGAYNATPQTITIQLNDNQTTPVKTKFTFTDMQMSAQSKEIRELGIIQERITCSGKDCTLGAGS